MTLGPRRNDRSAPVTLKATGYSSYRLTKFWNARLLQLRLGFANCLKIFHSETGRASGLADFELSGDAYPLSNQVTAFAQCVSLWPAGKQERMRQIRYIQLQGTVLNSERAVSNHFDFGCGEARVLNRLGNPGWIEGFPRLGKYFGLPFHQIHICAINAIQALQSLLGSVCSKTSYHSVDFDCGLLDLRQNGHSSKKRCQPQQKHRAQQFGLTRHGKTSKE